MGCDIHAFIEIKKKNSEKWEIFKEDYFNDRNYWLFSLIAGVREGAFRPSQYFRLRGIPSDASDRVKKYVDDWGYDLHSKSWLSPSDLEFCVNNHAIKEKLDDWRSPYEDLMKYEFFSVPINLQKSDPESQYRVIFGFDN